MAVLEHTLSLSQPTIEGILRRIASSQPQEQEPGRASGKARGRGGAAECLGSAIGVAHLAFFTASMAALAASAAGLTLAFALAGWSPSGLAQFWLPHTTAATQTCQPHPDQGRHRQPAAAVGVRS
jgi:hypothetical protein